MFKTALGTFLIAFAALLCNAEQPTVQDASPSARGQEPAQAVDSQWRTVYTTAPAKADTNGVLAHITLDFKQTTQLYGFVLIPNGFTTRGRIKDYTIYAGAQTSYMQNAACHKGSFPEGTASYWPDDNEKLHTVFFDKPVTARYLTLAVRSSYGDGQTVSIAEFCPITNPKKIPYAGQSLGYLKGERMAPSVHLAYQLPRSRVFYNEITPRKSVPGTYFVTAGFEGGYFGIQEQDRNRRVLLFSVWDPHNTNNPNETPENKRVKVLYQNPAMTVKRFGGEGVGVQSFCLFDWNPDSTYKFALRADVLKEQNMTVYSAFIYDDLAGDWTYLMSLGVPGVQRYLGGLHAFAEDFKRNFDSFYQNRRADFTGTYALDLSGKWVTPRAAVFTVDGNPRRNIDAGSIANGMYLSTGGTITPQHRPYSRIGMKTTTPPPQLPEMIVGEKPPFEMK